MRFAKLLLAALWLVAAGCGDDSSTTGGSGGTAGSGGAGGIDAPMVDAPGGTGGTGGTGGMTDGGFNRTDAALSDAGSYKTPITPNSVPCLANGSPTTCTTPQDECCAVLTDAGSANIMCTAVAGNACPQGAVLSLACDGPEDCSGNQMCCGARMGGGAFATHCVNGTMCPTMERPMCHDHTQCPSTLTSCCQVSIAQNTFTGRCYAAGMEPTNTACDTP